MYVVESLARPLLTRSVAARLYLLSRLCGLTTDDYKAKVMCHDYPPLFEGLGTMKDEYTIKLKDDVKPFALTVPKQVPTPLYEDTTHKIARMLESRVISPVDHLTEWCSTMVVTTKLRSEVRVCIDLTKLNEYVQHKISFPPICGPHLGKATGAKYFTKPDSNSGFWLKVQRPLKTFITPWGRYCFNVLPALWT